MTPNEAKQEVQKLTMMRIELHKYDEIGSEGRRRVKKINMFGNLLDDDIDVYGKRLAQSDMSESLLEEKSL
jgi:hypothetical protein